MGTVSLDKIYLINNVTNNESVYWKYLLLWSIFQDKSFKEAYLINIYITENNKYVL